MHDDGLFREYCCHKREVFVAGGIDNALMTSNEDGKAFLFAKLGETNEEEEEQHDATLHCSRSNALWICGGGGRLYVDHLYESLLITFKQKKNCDVFRGVLRRRRR